MAPQPFNRFIILGDPHVHEEERQHWAETWEDINALNPDAVLMLGDLTTSYMGEDKGLRLAKEIFKDCSAPWYSIIGNHDLQGRDFESDQDNLNNILHHLGRETPYFSIDIGMFTVIGLSNTVHRGNKVSTQELTLGAEQLAWFKAEVEKKSRRPIIVLSHAPILGSDLLNMPELHVVVGNCYMNQNDRPGDLMQIVFDNPNILFWFSGHCHLSHIYERSITSKLGCHFVHCGIVSRKQSRDGNNHTRVFDIYDDHFTIRTLDHSIRDIDEELEYRDSTSTENLLNYRQSIQGKRHVPRSLTHSNQKAVHSLPDIKLLWLSDLHVSGFLYPTQKRVIDWCRYEAFMNAIDGIVLGGDMVQNGRGEDLEIFLRYLSLSIPIYIIAGNHEGVVLRPEGHPNVVIIDEDMASLPGLPDNLIFLSQPQGSRDDEHLECIESVEADNLMILAHHPITPRLAKALKHKSTTWICGHTHEHKIDRIENVEMIISGALDPIKARHSPSEMLMLNIKGSQLSAQRLQIPLKRFFPSRIKHISCGLSTPSPEGKATAPWLQIPLEGLEQIQDYEGHLSLRLGTMEAQKVMSCIPELPHRVKHICLQLCPMAEELGFVDSELSSQGHEMLASYLALADRCVQHDIHLDIEQSVNIDDGQERTILVGGMPWHFSILFHEFRQRFKNDEVGFCFNTSTGFAVKASNVHPTFQNWIVDLKDLLHSAIIAQVEAQPRKTMVPITTQNNPLMNIMGTKAILNEARPGVLQFVYGQHEREAEEALKFYRTFSF